MAIVHINMEVLMGQQIPKPHKGEDIPDLPPADQAPERNERETPMHDEGLGKPPRQPGQIDIEVHRLQHR